MGTINFFRDGIKETWQVPGDLAIAIKNIDTPLTPTWLKFLETPNKILKKFSTSENLSFTIPNKFRDKQTAALTAQSFIDEMVTKTGVKPKDIAIEREDLVKLYKESGGFGASIFEEGEDKIFENLRKSGIAEKLDSFKPTALIKKVNEGIEQSTRLAVFKQALESGLTPKDAALVARDATVDFAKMGSWMQPLNKAIPFLNARVQGFANLPKAFINNPETFARMQMYTSVYPTILLHQYNRRFDSYKNISQYIKNKYWVIMTGEVNTRNQYNGDPMIVPQFITIPKGEGQSLVSSPIQWYLEKADKTDYRKVSEMIADTVGSASPLGFQSFNSGNIWLSMASQLGPVATIPFGLATGKDPFFGTDIVPPSRTEGEAYQQYKYSTPEFIKDTGKILNISPAKIEFVLSAFGGGSKDLQKSADIVYGVVRDKKIGGHPITDTVFGQLAEAPITRTIFREATDFYSPESELRKQQKADIEKQVKEKQINVSDKVNEIWANIQMRETQDERLNYLNSLGDELTPEIRKKLYSLKTTRSTVEALSKFDDVEVRARYILMRLQEMKQQKVTPEEQIKFLDTLEANKILTKDVKKLINEIKEE
ncbi:MAG: LPD38 domain-containing protein [Candidatus Heimdallarchaeaceae archaeon]